MNVGIVWQLRVKASSVSKRDREVTVSLIVVSLCFCLCLGGLGILARLSLHLGKTNPRGANLVNYIRVGNERNILKHKLKKFSLVDKINKDSRLLCK